jgi:hypothetical protein
MTRKYRRKGGQPGQEIRPPEVFSMVERDIESQIPISKEDMRYSESGDLIPPPPPYREVRKKASQKPQVSEPELDNIDKPFGERTFIGPQQKTSVRPLRDDIEAPLQNNPEFSGLDKDSGYGIYDDQFDGGKLRRMTKKKKRRAANKRKTKRKTKTKRNKKIKTSTKSKK